MRFRWTISVLLVVASAAHGQESGIEFFEMKIRPVLVEHCYQCHSKQTGKERGGLRLDTRESLRTGGVTGPAIVPGKPADSLLIKAVRHASDDLKMPRDGKLRPEVARVRRGEAWVEAAVRDVLRGERVAVRPGDRVPLDGVIREGRSAFDQAAVTGESVPVDKGPGDEVWAGTINVSASFELEVTRRAS